MSVNVQHTRSRKARLLWPGLPQKLGYGQLQPVSKKVETLLVKNAIYDIFILLPCIAPFPPDQCCPNFRIIFKLLGSNFEMGRGVQNKIYMFIFEARAYL